MQLSSFKSPLSSFPDSTSFPREKSGDRYLWELLHSNDRHESDYRSISQEGLAVLQGRKIPNPSESITVGSPDWVFVCEGWNSRLTAALILRNGDLIAAIQKDAEQLKLVTFDFLSARLIEALFELGEDARVEDEIGDRFWKRAETVSWRHGLGTLGYSLESFSSEVSTTAEAEAKADRLHSLSEDALPNAFAARQLRILYKYG